MIFDLVSIALFAAIVILATTFLSGKNGRRWLTKNLPALATTVFIAGVCIYLVGFYEHGTKETWLGNLLRSVLASLGMFLSDSEFIEVSPECKNSKVYVLLFGLVHFLAVFTSAALVVQLLGLRARSYLRMTLARGWQKKTVHVFFDQSDSSITLAKDIREKFRAAGRSDCSIVFVNTPQKAGSSHKFSLSGILSKPRHDSGSHLEEMIDMDAFIVYEGNSGAGMVTLDHYIRRCSKETRLFCLSDDESANIDTALRLRQMAEKTTAVIYCHAERNEVTEALEDDTLRIIDSHSMAAQQLKNSVESQPVSFVAPDPDTAAATKPFEAMIVGFGKTGLDLFKFLYEFASLVDKDGRENPFTCHIIDPKAELRESELYAKCPAMKSGGPFTRRTLDFMKGTVVSHREKVESLIGGSLDYIAVCTDDDQLNLETGLQLMDMALKLRDRNARLRIFVSVFDESMSARAEIAAGHFNDNGCDFRLVPFGSKKDMFSADNIVKDKLLEQAKTFYYAYEKGASPATESERDALWNERHAKLSGKGLRQANELAHKEFQDMANALHIKTKMRLCGADTSEERKTRLLAYADSIDPKAYSYEDLCAEIEEYDSANGTRLSPLLSNMAKCEHLRWSAASVVMGYTRPDNPSDRKNYIKKTHYCLLSDEEMLARDDARGTIPYDYNVFSVSCRLERDDKRKTD